MLVIFAVSNAHADQYIIGGAGAGETCAVNMQSDNCSEPSLLLRGVLGNEINPYLRVEGSADALVNSIIPREYSHSKEDKVSVLTLGLSAFATLPLSNSLRLFVGPSVGASAARISVHTDVWDNNESGRNARQNNTDFGVNYGWSAGIDVGTFSNGVVRLQWQNWRSLDSNGAYAGEFDANYLSINFIAPYSF
ncbi:MAG: hypothetical protein EOO68_18555 [Moraxellaceae bacterium]|nr:MAG: hypothetical protein EOO68_18555 [Moraxellaceae bacterium]